jgi:hypothetical protein
VLSKSSVPVSPPLASPKTGREKHIHNPNIAFAMMFF